jgi:phage terminase small subunit
MTHRGRKSRASLSLVTVPEPVERLVAPAFLTEEEREIFADLVASTTPKHFKVSDAPLLTAYCQSVATQRMSSREFKRAPLLGGRASPWAAVEEKAIRSMVALSMRLRLSPQARDRHQPSRAAKKLSYYERAALARPPAFEEDADDDE